MPEYRRSASQTGEIQALISTLWACYAIRNMEREGQETTIRLVRAIRSLAYNRHMQPLVAQRIERAEAAIHSYLLLRDAREAQIGPYEVKVDEVDNIHLKQLYVNDWHQMPLSMRKGQEDFANEPADARSAI